MTNGAGIPTRAFISLILILAIAVVWRITKRQDEKYRRIISDSSWVS